jgi:hypothetical protein
MGESTIILTVGLGALLILVWIGSEEARRQWKRALRRRRCPHPVPGLEGTYRSRRPGWVRQVYYCPDCKALWARRVRVTEAEWRQLHPGGEADRRRV